MTPPPRMTFSEAAAFAASSENPYSRTFVSKNALSPLIATTGIGFEPIELEVLGKEAAVLAQPRQHVLQALGALDLERAGACDANVYVVALLQVHDIHDSGGEPDGEAVSPLGDLHPGPLDIRWVDV